MNKQQLLSSLKSQGFSKEILNAFSKVLRENFIPSQLKSRAYEDTALPIGKGQTISQPYTIAMMLSLLELRKSQKVLEVGSGCGYVLALLSQIVDKVFGIEIIKELADKSKQNLKHYKNIEVYHGNAAEMFNKTSPRDFLFGGREFTRASPQNQERVWARVLKKSHHGTGRASLLGSDKLEKSMTASQWTSCPKNRLGSFDGAEGLEERAPFHRILISAACEKIPEKLLYQLKDNGILVAPVGEHEQSLVAVQKIKNKFIIKKKIPGFVFVKFVE